MSKEELRVYAALKALGWQGGTIYQIANEFGISADSILYGRVSHPIQGALGYLAAEKIKLDSYSVVSSEVIQENKGKISFWVGFLDTLSGKMIEALKEGETFESLLRKPKN